MTDPAAAEPLIAAGVGAAGSVLGGSYVALDDNMSRKQMYATLLACLMLGSFTPAAITHYIQIPWGVSGLIGVVLGLGGVPIVKGIRKLTARIGDKPGEIAGAFIPNQAIRDALRDSPETAKKEGGS